MVAQADALSECGIFNEGCRSLVAECDEPDEPEGDVRKVGEVFRDCPECPEMVVVPAGIFVMGSSSNEEGHYSDEAPQHRVRIAKPFAVGVYEVTFGEWDACVSGGGCGHRPGDEDWGRGSRPVNYVSWNDAREYVGWLSGRTGHEYRLLSEAEWEYAARAGTTTAYSWGNEIGSNRAHCFDCGSQWSKNQTAPVGSFPANAFGLYDMHGNVLEWVEDCFNEGYAGAPANGEAWLGGNCSKRVLRGGSWGSDSWVLRSASRLWGAPGFRGNGVGFRVARTLTP